MKKTFLFCDQEDESHNSINWLFHGEDQNLIAVQAKEKIFINTEKGEEMRQ